MVAEAVAVAAVIVIEAHAGTNIENFGRGRVDYLHRPPPEKTPAHDTFCFLVSFGRHLWRSLRVLFRVGVAPLLHASTVL